MASVLTDAQKRRARAKARLNGASVIRPPAPVSGPVLPASVDNTDDDEKKEAKDDDGWKKIERSTPAERQRIRQQVRQQVRDDPKTISLARGMLQEWLNAVHAERNDISGGPVEKEIVKCCWIYVTSSGKLERHVAENQPNRDEITAITMHHARVATPAGTTAKPTICAEDLLFYRADSKASLPYTICSVAYNVTRGLVWNACSTANGGCKRRMLAERIIVYKNYEFALSGPP